MDTRRNIIISVTLQTEKSRLEAIDTTPAQKSIDKFTSAVETRVAKLSQRVQSTAREATNKTFERQSQSNTRAVNTETKAIEANTKARERREMVVNSFQPIGRGEFDSQLFSVGLRARLNREAQAASRLSDLQQGLRQRGVPQNARALDNARIDQRIDIQNLRKGILSRYRQLAQAISEAEEEALRREFGLGEPGFGRQPRFRSQFRSRSRAASQGGLPSFSGAVTSSTQALQSVGLLAAGVGQLGTAADSALSPMTRIANLIGGLVSSGSGLGGLLRSGALRAAGGALAGTGLGAAALVGGAIASPVALGLERQRRQYLREAESQQRIGLELQERIDKVRERSNERIAKQIAFEEKVNVLRSKRLEIAEKEREVALSQRDRARDFDRRRADAIDDPARRFNALARTGIDLEAEKKALEQRINILRTTEKQESVRNDPKRRLEIKERIRDTREDLRSVLSNLLGVRQDQAGIQDQRAEALKRAREELRLLQEKQTPLDRADPEQQRRLREAQDEVARLKAEAAQVNAGGNFQGLQEFQEKEITRLLDAQQANEKAQGELGLRFQELIAKIEAQIAATDKHREALEALATGGPLPEPTEGPRGR